MSAPKSGRIIKTKKGKKGTTHQRNHRWESFTTKLSKLNSLDPIRRVRRHDLDAEDVSTTTSYLKSGLGKWQELNISESFNAFCREILPMSDSLPQILYSEDRIMQLFAAHLEKREKESLEPLLELVTDFAHDLGSRFEKHYAKVLTIICAIAGKTHDVEVIEWSFTSLAFMFKYLSKLLVPNLVPTYGLMTPLLGKQHRQPHIARFAAEAMSFLVRKAAAPAHREKALPLIINHIRVDLRSVTKSKEYGLYLHGVMTLFAEAMKGNGLAAHTCAPTIFRGLFLNLRQDDLDFQDSTPWMDVICGVLTSIIHHTNATTFRDLLDVVVEQADAAASSFARSSDKSHLYEILLSARTIAVVVGVRKGSRLNDWSCVLTSLSNILRVLSRHATSLIEDLDSASIWRPLILSVSITFQYVPINVLIPFISSFMETLTKEPLAPWYLTFCAYTSEADPERFRTILLPYFQRFVVAHWSDADNGDTLAVLLPRMVSTGSLPSVAGKDGFPLPQSWQDQIVSKFERLEVSPFPEQASPAIHDRSPTTWHDRCLPKYNALLEVLETTLVHPSTNARISEILIRKLRLALRPSSSLAPEEANFIVGRGFSAFSKMMKASGEIDTAIEPLLWAAAPRYARSPHFLEALLGYERSLQALHGRSRESTKRESESEIERLLIDSLVSNLATESHELRLLSLQLLEHLYLATSSLTSEALNAMLMVEQIRLDLQTVRTASMYIRKLAILFSNESVLWLKEAIPTFCFGMLTVNFAQIWEDASATLKHISETKAGEEIVANLAFTWLETPSHTSSGSHKEAEHDVKNGFTDFECSNLIMLNELGHRAEGLVPNARHSMLQKFATAQALVAPRPQSARTQALRVLTSTSQIAERRSRIFIPFFLSWADRLEQIVEELDDIQGTVPSDWTRKDQKAQLNILSLFINPKSLYKSEEVYNALLRLLTNGDIEIQKSALKAIHVWKHPSIRPYEENLFNILDEARFKDELGLLLHGESLIQSEHRSAVMPVLLRLLYGRSISRTGAASGKQGMEARRLAILRALDMNDVGDFLSIALGDLMNIRLFKDGKLNETIFATERLDVRKQVGLTHMIEGVTKELGSKIIPYIQPVLDVILYCTIYCTRQLQERGVDDIVADTPSQASLLKVVRQTGLKSLVLLFANAADYDWKPYIGAITVEIISPRLEDLPVETSQGISVLLRLFASWAGSTKSVLYLGVNDQILPKLVDCLAPTKSKDEVKLFVLGIMKSIVKIARDDGYNCAAQVRDELTTPNVDHFLTQIGGVLRSHHDVSKALLEACVETVSQIAPLVTISSQAHNLIEISTFLLAQPSRRVSPKTKGELLLMLEVFVPLYGLQDDMQLRDEVYNVVTSLFGFFRDKTSREVLSRVLLIYSKDDPVPVEVALICTDLNSFLESRLDEPDYDRRLKAFNAINLKGDLSFTAWQWRPILFNLLFYIKHDEEFGILSSNSCDGIRTFIDIARKAQGGTDAPAFMDMLSTILMPAIYSGARESSEIVRREFLKVMAHVVRTFYDWAEVCDMRGLLAGEEEVEASFFNNLISAGKGRQSSALGQLCAASERKELSGKNVGHFFIPLVEHFVFDRADGNEAHSLAAESIATLAVLSNSLEWPQYRAMLRRFMSYIEEKPELEKHIIRLLGRIIETLSAAVASANVVESRTTETVKSRSTLSKTVPKGSKLAEDLSTNILPALTKYLHDKNESTVSLRVPVAVIVVRLLQLLPQEQLHERLPAILTDVCHILRSKAQESRDLTRDTLTKICTLLGPSCVGFVLKELRGALTRGYQLHVLSYTLHSILVATTPQYTPGDLDYCLPSIVAIIMDDIFGVTGQEKDAEEYVSKMKEVKSSKSHDSMELIARTATLTRLTDLVRPIQILLKEKLNIRMINKIDELLVRISNGLLKNSAAGSRDSLIFCYEVIQEVRNGAIPQSKAKDDYRLKKYLIQKGAKKSGERGTTSIHTYKLLRFALDVLRSVLKKNDRLRTTSNLTGFVPVIGDMVLQGEHEVKSAAFKLLSTIAKVPLKVDADGTNLYKVATTEAVRAISADASTHSDIAQAALKLISVTLRDRKDVSIKDTAIDELLTRLKDDMTQPDRRHVIFNFIRAIIDSQIQTAVIYDTLDYVGTVMVTNDDKDTRDLARGAYFQFLRDYPQKKSRWSKQLAFIVANLKYDREGGRLSILEVIHLLLSKSNTDFIPEVSATCFVPLIFVLVNDESEKCRMAAGEVMKTIFAKADAEKISTFKNLLRSWIKQDANPSVVNLAYQTFGFYYDSRSDDGSDVQMLSGSILTTLHSAIEHDASWEQIYAALQLATVLAQKFESVLLSSKMSQLWSAIRVCISFPHAWVKLSASKLVSIYFVDFARTNAAGNIEGLPLEGSAGLTLTATDITELIWRTTSLLRTPGLSSTLADEAVKNLVFLGRCAAVNDVRWRGTYRKHESESESEAESDSDQEIKTGDQSDGKKSALQFMFGRLSFILRRETQPPRSEALIPKTSALQLITHLTSILSPAHLIPSLRSILLPLSNLTDPAIPSPYSTDESFRTGYEELKSSASAVMESLKKTVGTQVYSETLIQVREGVRERRTARSAKRKVEAVAAPERFGEAKRKKVERKKERRKEKGREHAKRRNEY